MRLEIAKKRASVSPTNGTSNGTGFIEEEQVSWLNLRPSAQISSWSYQDVLREHTKTLNRIAEEEEGNVDASGTQFDLLHERGNIDHEALQRRTKFAVGLRKARVETVLKKMSVARQLDLCFLVDITKSMRPYIDGVKNSIRTIVDRLTKETPGQRRSIVDNVCLLSSNIFLSLQLASYLELVLYR